MRSHEIRYLCRKGPTARLGACVGTRVCVCQGSPCFATLIKDILTPVLQFKRVFYTFIKDLKGIKSIFVFVLLLNLGSLCVRATLALCGYPGMNESTIFLNRRDRAQVNIVVTDSE